MTPEEIKSKTIEYVQGVHAGDTTGHDWPHIMRVLGVARHLADGEDVDDLVIQLAALLHDVADKKLVEDTDLAKIQIVAHLSQFDTLTPEQADHILSIIDTIGWSSEGDVQTLEGRIVQDADRLDAIGAIGVARCFAYGGSKGVPIYDPMDLAKEIGNYSSKEAARRSSIAHFYDKLTLLEGKMNTLKAKAIARRRTAFLEAYLDQFFQEWNVIL